jgi:surface polysaccharide O-acyltransferase-like enzyme
MGNKRDYSIDFFKGITAISIIFIHTVWWSGQSYVPNIVAQFSLLIDVPLFFFLSGAGAYFAFAKPNPFSGILRLIVLFALFFTIYAIIFEPNNTFNFAMCSLFVKYPWASKVEIACGSTWFIPVFVIVYLLGYLIITHVGNKNILIVICVFLLICIYQYDNIEVFKNLRIHYISADFIFSNLFFFIFGYYYYKELRSIENIQTLSGILFLIALFLTISHFKDIPFDLQSLKFPHRFYYVIASLISVSIAIFMSTYIKKEYLINFVGKNALQFYLAQGISSGLLYYFLPIIDTGWILKLILIFTINITITSIFAFLIIKIYSYFNLRVSASIRYIDNLKIKN